MYKKNRKIIRVGKSSLAVIIPMEWLRYNQLGDGDDLDVSSNEKIIIQKTKSD